MTGPRRRAVVAVLTLAAIAVIAVAVWIYTMPRTRLVVPGDRFEVASQPGSFGLAQACMAALLEGVLVEDETYGFVVRDPIGGKQVVLWPPGYHGLWSVPPTLVDEAGVPVGRAGDRLQIMGGLGVNDAWVACAFERPVVVANGAST